jgi:cobalt-zinc-cadmium resistance protein CzcA
MIKINVKILLCLILLSASFCYSQKSITIDEAVKTAVDNNLQIRSGMITIEKEEAVKLKSFNIPRPELFIEYEGIKGSINNFDIRKIGISQELEFPSNYFLRSDVQSSQVQISREELHKLSNELRADVKQSYYRLLLNMKLLEIAKEKLKLYDEFLFCKKYSGSGTNLKCLGKSKRLKPIIEKHRVRRRHQFSRN